MGTGIQRGRLREVGLFMQDAWRVRPNLTVNAGLRYDMQYPFYPLNSSYSYGDIADVCGSLRGRRPSDRATCSSRASTPGGDPAFQQFEKGRRPTTSTTTTSRRASAWRGRRRRVPACSAS